MITNLQPAIPTMALGFGVAGHSMPDKLHVAAEAGFEGVEIFYACLESYAETFSDSESRDRLRAAARATGSLCKSLNLNIIALQPLINYEGILDTDEHSVRVEECAFRFELCKLLGTNTLQIAASFRRDDGVTGDKNKIVADLQELADLASKLSPPIRLAYENLGWSTYINTWQEAVNIVNAVNRDNFGLCLDAFNIAAFEYADPEIRGGIRPDGPQRLKDSLSQLPALLPIEKVWYIQLVDCEKLDIPISPISPYYVEGQPARMSWSRNCRVYPFEEDRGGYLPIPEIARALIDVGYRGYISLELWNRFVVNEKSPAIPKESAARGWESWKKVHRHLVDPK